MQRIREGRKEHDSEDEDSERKDEIHVGYLPREENMQALLGLNS